MVAQRRLLIDVARACFYDFDERVRSEASRVQDGRHHGLMHSATNDATLEGPRDEHQ